MRYNVCALRGRGEGWHLHLEVGSSHATNAVDSVQKDNLVWIEWQV